MLFYKGFHGLQLYRCANVLWRNGQTSSAALLQSLTSEIFGMDIHPAATIGAGILIGGLPIPVIYLVISGV